MNESSRDNLNKSSNSQEILKTRAMELTRKLDASQGISNSLKLIEFELMGERLALETRWAVEAVPLESMTPVPGTPDFIFGITLIRGKVYSVVDLGFFFQMDRKGIKNDGELLLIEGQGNEFGISCDRVIGYKEVETGSLSTDFPTISGRREEYLLGITPDGLVILDGESLLGDPNMRVNSTLE